MIEEMTAREAFRHLLENWENWRDDIRASRKRTLIAEIEFFLASTEEAGGMDTGDAIDLLQRIKRLLEAETSHENQRPEDAP